MYVCPSVWTYVHPSIHKVFPISNEIWYIDRGQWVIHDGMPYEFLSKVKVMEVRKLQKWPISFKVSSSSSMHVINRLMVNCDTSRQYLIFLDRISTSFGITWPSNLGIPPSANEFCLLWVVGRQSRMGLILFVTTRCCNVLLMSDVWMFLLWRMRLESRVWLLWQWQCLYCYRGSVQWNSRLSQWQRWVSWTVWQASWRYTLVFCVY